MHGTPEQLKKIREYLGDIMDNAGEQDRKQAAVYRNRRFWHVLVLGQASNLLAIEPRKILSKQNSARCAPQRLYLGEEDLGDDPPKVSRKYRSVCCSE